MEIDYKKPSPLKKLFTKLCKYFTQDTEVIQIGIGGTTSSGKTLLIDGISRLFNNNNDYMSAMTKGWSSETDFKDSEDYTRASNGIRYRTSEDLSSDIMVKFTRNEGIHTEEIRSVVEENMYFLKLKVGGKKRLFLFRNLPGEMFDKYFDTGTVNKSPRDLYKDFEDNIKDKYSSKSIQNLLNNKIDFHDLVELFDAELFAIYIQDELAVSGLPIRELYKDFYRDFGPVMQNPPINWYDRDIWINFILDVINRKLIYQPNRKMHLSMLVLFQLRMEFMKYCATNNEGAIAVDLNIEKYFYPFLFYYTSNVNIYCISAATQQLASADHYGIRLFNYRNDKIHKNKQQHIICITQFDRMLNENNFRLNLLHDGLKGDDSESKSTKYWQQMNAIYHDLNKYKDGAVNHESPVDLEKWDRLKAMVSLWSESADPNRNWFITSVAYNYSRERFFRFNTTLNNIESEIGENVWNRQNFNSRSSVGVLEMMLYILNNWGVKHNRWNLDLSNTVELAEIRDKIGIQ
jgi:hypothetical protein